MMRLRVVLAILAALALLAPGHLAAAPAKPKPKKPDLKIVSGSALGSPGRVAGSFTVKNAGTKKAKASSVAVTLNGASLTVVAMGRLKPDRKSTLSFSGSAAPGRYAVRACADAGDRVAEKKEGNNCRLLGTVTVTSPTAPGDPLAYTADTVFSVPAAGTSPGYALLVPTTYDASHQTPARLVVFMHGCGDTAVNLASVAKLALPSTRPFIFLSLGGRDGGCFDTASDQAGVQAAVADVKTHFNIAPKLVVLGGYSGGSTLAGKVAFTNANSFAGLLVMVGRPFTSDSDRTAALAGAARKIPVVWRAHTADGTFPIATARADRDALQAAGFPLTYQETAGTSDYSTEDLTYVLSQIGSGWTAP